MARGSRRSSGFLCVFATCTLLVLIIGVGPLAAQLDNRVTVAVLSFDSSNVRKWWTWNWDIGDGLGDLVTEALVAKGSYRVLERAQMKRILGEQDFGRSGRVDESKAVEIGKLLGARLVIFGALTEFDYASTGSVRIGGIGISGSKARTKLNGRIVDAQTGEILGAVVGEGEESGATLSVNTYRGISFSSKEFRNSTVGKSVDRAVAAFADAAAIKIDEAGARLAAEARMASLSGSVVAIIPDGVIINLGSNAGIAKGQRLEVYRLMAVPGLAEPVRIPVGSIQIISVDPNAAVGRFESVTSPVEVGDVVSRE